MSKRHVPSRLRPDRTETVPYRIPDGGAYSSSCNTWSRSPSLLWASAGKNESGTLRTVRGNVRPGPHLEGMGYDELQKRKKAPPGSGEGAAARRE
jgi:hypothetical protein